MSRKGPRDKRNVRMTALAKDRKRPGRRVNDGERQRILKYLCGLDSNSDAFSLSAGGHEFEGSEEYGVRRPSGPERRCQAKGLSRDQGLVHVEEAVRRLKPG